MRATMETKPKPGKPMCLGDEMASWRRGKGQGYRKGGAARWYGRATIVGLEPGEQSLWASHGGSLIRVAKEHCRHATPTEIIGVQAVEELSPQQPLKLLLWFLFSKEPKIHYLLMNFENYLRS